MTRWSTIRNLLAAASLAVPVAAGTSAGAAAADGPNLRFCLTYSNGAAYASKPVTLYQWNGQRWLERRTGRTAANGCGTFFGVTGNAYYAVGGYWSYKVGSSVFAWSGYTWYVYVPHVTGATYETPRGWVTFAQLY